MIVVHFFSFTCSDCGRGSTYVHAGVSHEGAFIAEWKCIDCGKEIVRQMPIEQMIKMIPPPPKPPNEVQMDMDFLHEMKIGGDLNLGNSE